jgi:hypothetical protein
VRRHLTPSLVISLMALFVALGGASYAAIKIPKNSVGAAQIKKNAVTSAKVKDRSLLAKDFKAGQIPAGAKGDTGATGPAGPTASAYASNNINPNTSLPPGGVNVTVLDTTAPDAGSGTMTITTRSRVVADASVSLFKGTGVSGMAADVDCQIQAASLSGTVSIGQVARTTLTATVAGGAVYAEANLSGAISLDPGEYGFRVLCQQANGANSTATPAYDRGDLTVIATGI